MLLDLNTFLYDKIADQIFVSHLDKKIKFDIVEPDKIGSKFKSAMEKQGMLKDIKGADLIVRFAEKIETQPPEDEEKPEDSEDTEDNGEEDTEEAPEEEAPEEETSEKTDSEDTEEVEDKEETDDSEETTDDSTEEDAGEDKEEASDDTEDKEEEEDDEDKDDDKEEGLNESVKIQDLTKSMLITPKKTKSSTGSSKASSPKKESKKCTEAEDEKKSEKKTDDKKKKDNKKKETKKIIEAETKVTGDELKLRVQKATSRVFNIDKDKIEFVDVPECVDGYNVYYCKISFKDRPDQTEED